MKAAIGQIQDLLEEGQPLLARYLGEGPAQEFADFVRQRAANATPTVMVFGIYNAGKSTLLNALIGQECAAMSDRPETSKVTRYDWRGFTLLDTPGIDAPSDHETVSREQLERSDIVLFVLSNNGVCEERTIYDELIDIAMLGKPLMLIVNNKAGHREGDPEYRELHDRIQRNLEQAGQQRGQADLARRIPIWLVNARSALKGRLGDKDALVKASGLPPLERAIESLLRQCGTHEVATTLRQGFGTRIDSALARIASQEKPADAQLLAALQTAVAGEKSRIQAAAMSAIGRAAAGFRADFRAAIEAQDESRMRAASETAIAAVTHVVERELKTAAAKLATLGANMETVPLEVNGGATAQAFRGAASRSADFDHGDPTALGPVYDLMRDLTAQLTRDSIEQATRTGVHEALKLAKNWVPGLMKGIGAKGMAKIAEGISRTLGKGVPFIGPAIDTVRGIYNYRQAAAQQREYAQARERQLRDLAELVERQTEALKVELDAACRATVTEAFQPLESELTNQARTLDGASRTLVADRQALELLKTRLELLAPAPTPAPQAAS